MPIKLKRFKFTIRYAQNIEATETTIVAENLGSTAYRILKTMGWDLKEISEKEFLASGGKAD